MDDHCHCSATKMVNTRLAASASQAPHEPDPVAAVRAWPWLARPLPERAGRKVVCVVQLGALIALQLLALPAPAAGVVVSATLAALSWSFGRDVLWLWRARP